MAPPFLYIQQDQFSILYKIKLSHKHRKALYFPAGVISNYPRSS